MDNLRGFEPDNGDDGYIAYPEDDDAIEAPPLASLDERRMQVRAYNFWTSLLGNRNFPSIEDLEPEGLDDFTEFSVLLDFTASLDNPAIQFLGNALRAECELDESIGYLDQVPPRSLLSRITDHCLQIIANRAPIGFEAEFVNNRGATIMYRGILLPFSSDDDSVDFIYGVINWKEMLGAEDSAVLQLQLDQAMSVAQRPALAPVPAFADGPSHDLPEDEDDQPLFEAPAYHEPAPVIEIEAPAVQLDSDASLADWLGAARHEAALADEADGRSRAALYRAIGLAYDFALVAEAHPAAYAELLSDAGLTVQDRAPMTPIVKLVFGAKYDKTRLTEFAAALGYAKRTGLGTGELAKAIEAQTGGLKAIVKAERAARKPAKPVVAAAAAPDPRERFRRARSRSLSEFTGAGEEFVVLVGRREADGSVSIVGSMQDQALTEKVLGKAVD